MPRKVRHLLNRDGRLFARLVIPKGLRPFLDGKTELRTPLGSDHRAALRALPGAIALLQHRIAQAERRAAEAEGKPATSGRYPLVPEQLAHLHYLGRLDLDDFFRNGDPRYARQSPAVGDSSDFQPLRDAIAGKLDDRELDDLIGDQIERYRYLGNVTAEFGTAEWRRMARALCVSEYEALARVAERDEGNFSGKPDHPMLSDAGIVTEFEAPVPIRILFEDYVASRKLVGRQRDDGQRQRPVIENLVKFVKHDDARKLTRRNIIDWRDHLLQTLSPKTVSDIYLSAVRSMLGWAKENERLSENVADSVRQQKRKRVLSREKGYTTDEAKEILKLSRSYNPPVWLGNSTREHPSTTAAKRWIPILCAFTGARVSEMTQLRKQDVQRVDEIDFLRITPDAGTVKSGGYRDVPIHRQIVEEGFLEFVNKCSDGPLFSRSSSGSKEKQLASTMRLADALGEWLRKSNLVPEGLWPSHAFRHRFKTVGREIGVSDRVVDAICGHVGRTAGDDYGDVTIVAKRRVIDQFPNYDFGTAVRIAPR